MLPVLRIVNSEINLIVVNAHQCALFVVLVSYLPAWVPLLESTQNKEYQKRNVSSARAARPHGPTRIALAIFPDTFNYASARYGNPTVASRRVGDHDS